jgi:hypothetical protein
LRTWAADAGILDRTGQDWEFVQYHPEDPEKRNDYDDAG